MSRALLLPLAVVALALGGCAHHQLCCQGKEHGLAGLLPGSCAKSPETCQSCTGGDCTLSDCRACKQCGQCEGVDPGACRPLLHCRRPAFTPGPPTGAITYPYYTLRGPRDFLARRARPIGP